MPVVGKDLACRSMCGKGFSEILGGDHRRFEYWVNGSPVCRTKVSHGGGKDLNAYLLGCMAKGCHLSRDEFTAFARCEMSEAEYRQILIDKGIIQG